MRFQIFLFWQFYISITDCYSKFLPDCQNEVSPVAGLYDGHSPVVNDGVPVNRQDGSVPVPHPGHAVVVHLVDPAGQVGHLPLPHRDVPRGVEGEVGPGVETSQLGPAQITPQSWRVISNQIFLTIMKTLGNRICWNCCIFPQNHKER